MIIHSTCYCTVHTYVFTYYVKVCNRVSRSEYVLIFSLTPPYFYVCPKPRHRFPSICLVVIWWKLVLMWLSILSYGCGCPYCKIARSSVILLLPLIIDHYCFDFQHSNVRMCVGLYTFWQYLEYFLIDFSVNIIKVQIDIWSVHSWLVSFTCIKSNEIYDLFIRAWFPLHV